MSGPDTLSQAFGTLLLALAFSAFIVFVRGYRPGGSAAPGTTWCSPSSRYGWRSGPKPAYSHARRAWPMPWGWSWVGATLLGCLLGYGVARGLRRAMRETRQKIGFFAGESARFVAEISRKHI